MLSVWLLAAAIITVWTMAAIVNTKIYRDVTHMWELKKDQYSVSDVIKYNIYMVLETKVYQRAKGYKGHVTAAAKHVAGVYDYISSKEPDIMIANQLLKEKTVIQIVDFWNGPNERLLKIKLASTKNHKEHILILPMKVITKQAYKLKDEEIYGSKNKTSKLRVIK